jgi:hypothetical protein
MSRGPVAAQRFVLEFLEAERARGERRWIRADAIAYARAGGIPTNAQVVSIRRALHQLEGRVELAETSDAGISPVAPHPAIAAGSEKAGTSRLVARTPVPRGHRN